MSVREVEVELELVSDLNRDLKYVMGSLNMEGELESVLGSGLKSEVDSGLKLEFESGIKSELDDAAASAAAAA